MSSHARPGKLVPFHLVVLASLGLVASVRAQNPPPTQLFYVPFPEDQQLVGFKAINTVTPVVADPITVFVTLAAATDGTVIFYDHWEDGYERNITNPVQSTTRVFGDGNAANGYPPGNPSDLIPAGTVFNLRNFVVTTTLQSVVDYDARDKIASFKPISVTKTSIPAGTNTLLAGCVEVFERGLWGTEYRSPVGENMPTTTPASPLTQDENAFSYAAFAISAGPGGASVQIDKDNAGGFEETVVLAEGETVYRNGVNVGGHVLSDRPVQVILFTGTVGSNYASRDTSLLPVNRWSSDYFAPVTTPAGDGTVTYLYNPGGSAITVSYDYRNSAATYTTATVSVPAGGNARVVMAPAGTGHSGAYRFYTTGNETFYAMSAVDADAASGGNQAWDGGFTLVGRPSLTTQVLLSLGIGRDPYSTTNPDENGNPLWLTTAGNGHTQVRVYVDFNGDNSGPNTDPNGNQYDVHHDLRELEQLKVFDPDGDQSGMLVYTLSPSVRIAAAWAQDPLAATAAQPGIDVASLVPPMREGDAGKISTLAVDAGGDGYVSPGDTLEYDLRAVSNARTNIPGPFAVQDNLPADATYVAGTTRYRFMVNGSWQAWTSIPDNGSGTPFPLDGTGFSVPGTLNSSQQFQVTFRAVVDTRANLSGTSIENTGQVEISPYGLLLPISWTDTIYGSIANRVWTDLDGDGVEDAGEPGIANVDVYADLNNNGIRDAGEPADVTDAVGNYVLGGLAAGSYIVRVDPADIAAVNVGYGPTYDLDGNGTAHVATVALGAAEDRLDADFGYRVGASVGNRVWADLNGNATQDASEVGLNGVRAYLDLNNNNAFDSGEPNTLTSGDGIYYIGNLNPGTYTVRIDTSTLPAGATQTHDLNGGLDHEAVVTLVGAEHRGDLDFGYRGNASIGDLVWDDVIANGTPLVDIRNGRIDLNDSNSTSTADDGFIGSVRIIDGYVDLNNDNQITAADAGTFQGFTVIAGGLDSNGVGGITNDDDLNLSIMADAGIAGVRVYIDANGNGVFNAGEISAVTNASGAYTISNLFDGTHLVRVDPSTLPNGYAQTYDLTSPTTDDSATVVLVGVSRTDVDFGYRKEASLGDIVWNDRDADGIRDAGEPGIEGVIVYIDSDGDNAFDQGVERYAITGVDGSYLIENLTAGTYSVRVDISTIPQGAVQTHDLGGVLDHEASRVLTATEDAIDVDFGYRATAGFGNFVWNDSDADGIQDGGEAGIPNVVVYVDSNGNGSFDSATEPSATTNASGAYSIGNLLAGTYTARIVPATLPAGMTQTYDALGALDHAATFSLSDQEVRTEIDFGYTSQATIGDLVWNDIDGDGQKDAGETGISGVTVTLYRASNDTIAGTAVTDSNGLYSFTGVTPGSYYLVFGAVPGFNRTTANQGSDASDSDANAAGRTANVTVIGGQTDLTVDAGYYQPATISGTVFADTNNDNVGDVGLAGVTLTLFTDPNGDGNPADGVASGSPFVTLVGGAYSFTNLAPGAYVVVETQPAGYLTATDVDATTPGDDATNSSTTDNAIPVAVLGNETDNGNNFVEEQPGVISGTVFADTNNDNAGDIGLAGVTLTLFTDPNGDGNPADGSAVGSPFVTLAGGAYSFTNLPPGAYVVVETQPSGYLTVTDVDSTTPGDDASNSSTTDNRIPVAISANETDNGNDFIEEQPGVISGSVFADTNNDNTGDVGIAGVTLTLFSDPNGDGNSADGTAIGSPFVTLAGGAYSFTNVPPGAYVVVETQPSGYLTVTDVDATTPGDDAANSSATDNAIPVAVTANETDNGNNFIEEQPGIISGTVFADTNNDNAGDVGIAGVTLTLFSDPNADGNPADGVAIGSPFVTLAGGAYSFTNLPPGAYVVVETQPSGYLTVTDVDTTTPGDDATNGSPTDNAIPVAVSANETDNGNDFIEEQPGVISGTVFADTNNDNAGDVGIAGVTLTLVDSSGNPVDGDPNTSGVQPITTTTAVNGSYSFTGLPPGTYGVLETQPSGYASVSDRDGGNLDEIRPIIVAPGATNSGNDFVEEQPGSLSGSVFADTDGDGDGDAPLENVTLRLLDAVGNPVDGDPNSPGVQPRTTLTLANGSYSFGGLPPGNYRVSEDQPAGYNSVSDTDGANNNLIGDETPIAVAAGNNSGGHDFIEIEPGSIAGHAFTDSDNNGSGDTALAGVTLSLLDGSGQPVLDGLNIPLTTVTGIDGSYLFANLPVGSYRVSQTQPAGYGSVSDVDGANNNLIGDETPIVLTPGLDVTGRDFVEVELGSIAGSVFDDTDDNGSGDAPLEGVLLSLLDGSGQPVLDGSNTPITATTAPDGSYFFGGLFPGTYQVAETQPANYGSVSDVDGGDPDLIGNLTAITVNPGQDITGRDFVEVELGAISGFVFVESDPLSGVTLTLLDENGDPVDGDPNEPGVQPITTLTAPDGSYLFTGVRPGIYQVGQTQPAGYDSFGDADGGDLDIVGDLTPVVVLPGEENPNNNFIETLDTCANTWDEWQTLHPGENAAGNPDADVLDNLAEFSFAQPYDSGAGDPFCIGPSEDFPGTIEGVFVRPKQATDNVTYVLEYAATLGSPTTWLEIYLEPGDLIVTDNGDCTETVTIVDLEDLTGLVGGEGFVRVRADLDEENDEEIDHVSSTAVEGWTRTPVEICCRTYNNPYLRCAAFTGTVDSASGNILDLTTSAGPVDLATLLTPGVSYYAEITSGENEGQRFDVVSATGDQVTVANDSSLASGDAPHNTLVGILPPDLDGDGIVIRRHWTLDELFPPENFGATGSESTADQVQVSSAGVWTIYWLYDDAGSPRWVNDGTLVDRGAAVIPPGQGMFFNSRHTTGTLLAWGQVRENDFIRPLPEGASLVGGGYPVDQTATGAASRSMTLAQGFFGTRNFKTADRFYVWKGDAVALDHGYQGYFLLNGAPVQPALIQWTKVGDASIQSRDGETLFLGDRAVFIDVANDVFAYEILSPWTP